ncbi:MAG: hypothetical protein JWN42_1723, partial [Candidatus Angelobacter sp.]|nr:hypothetical protein [Candidatus Angelobacter sp.]
TIVHAKVRSKVVFRSLRHAVLYIGHVPGGHPILGLPNSLPRRRKTSIVAVAAIHRDEINLSRADSEGDTVAAAIAALPFRVHDNVTCLRRRSQLKRNLRVGPYGILRCRASADRHRRAAALRAKALAPDRHPDAPIVLPAGVGAAFKIGEEDAGRSVRRRLPRTSQGEEQKG